MAGVLAVHRELTDRFAIHQDEPGFNVDATKEGRRATLALNTVEETGSAIRAYRKPRLRKLNVEEIVERRAAGKRWPGVGAAYLAKYGLLQAMQLQQLAAETIASSLGFDLALKTTNVMRLARHNAAAHPFWDHGLKEDHFLDRSPERA